MFGEASLLVGPVKGNVPVHSELPVEALPLSFTRVWKIAISNGRKMETVTFSSHILTFRAPIRVPNPFMLSMLADRLVLTIVSMHYFGHHHRARLR